MGKCVTNSARRGNAFYQRGCLAGTARVAIVVRIKVRLFTNRRLISGRFGNRRYLRWAVWKAQFLAV